MGKVKAEVLAMQERIAREPRIRERALQVLLARQTPTEAAARMTTERNGEGFTAWDAELLTSFAEQVDRNRWGRRLGERLTARQHAVAAVKLKKYAGQLCRIAAERVAT